MEEWTESRNRLSIMYLDQFNGSKVDNKVIQYILRWQLAKGMQTIPNRSRISPTL